LPYVVLARLADTHIVRICLADTAASMNRNTRPVAAKERAATSRGL
jgi:hypothetical protein